LVLPKNIWQYVVQIPRMAELGTRFVLQGGTQYNLAAVKAQHDYITSRVPGAVVHVHPHTGEAGAIGAALETRRVVRRRGRSRFIGLEAAIELRYTTRNDESTRCHFCANECARTFIDTRTPDGRTSRYIAGFSCLKGTVESKEAMIALTRERNRLKKRFVNLVEYESRLAFRSFYKPDPLPEAGTPIDDVEVRRTVLGRVVRRPVRRGFRRSSAQAAERRRQIRVGIPRVLNLYSVAPLFRTYFEALGIPKQNVVFSDPTSEEMWREGAKYGSIDPCFPAKVAQAHIHNLLFRKHRPDKGRPLDFIFFPALTHVPSFLEHTMDDTACPIVAGTPNVMKAAFTKEKDFFAERGIEYLDPPLTLCEPTLLRRQLFEVWGRRLGVTEDESDFAVAQGWEALRRFDAELQRRGLEVLERVEREGKVALLLLGRPYHDDPGLNHGILEEFQSLGYPILSLRSIPKDVGWLRRWFARDLAEGRIRTPLEINDVWPENYSANSAQKVWGAKFAARHPNVAVLDLSSFKCGNDAPTYGLIDQIIKASGTPYAALHDIDANKPSGSMKIRVKTYAYTLQRYEERLQDRLERMSELERRVARKRRELLDRYRERLQERVRSDPRLREEFEAMDAAFEAYLEEVEAVAGMRVELPRERGVAPLPPTEVRVSLGGGRRAGTGRRARRLPMAAARGRSPERGCDR
ncbi:MAG: CoA activase, partial [Planctomycetota bacterium]